MLITVMALWFATQATPPAQPAGGPADDKAAIIETVLDYADGFYEGSAERMAKAVHPLLSKRALTTRQDGTPRLSTMNSEMLIEAARAGGGKLPAAERGVKAEVLDVTGNLACARVFTVQFNDYLHLMRTGNGWRIVNVLWQPPVKETTAPDRATLSAVTRDYLAAMAGKNGQAVLDMLHPAVSFRVIGSVAGSSRLIVQELMADSVAEIVNAGRMPMPPEAGGTGTVTILDAYEGIAAVKMSAGPFLQYAHLAKLDGRWRVVNTLTYVQPPKK